MLGGADQWDGFPTDGPTDILAVFKAMKEGINYKWSHFVVYMVWLMTMLGPNVLIIRGDTLDRYIQVGDETVKRKMAMTLPWDRKDLVMDHMETLIELVKWIYFGINVELALNKGWIKYCTADGNEPDHVVQGPNLLLVPKDKRGPKVDFTEEWFYDGSVYKDYPNGFQKRPVMWVVESQGWKTLDDGVRFMFYPACTIGISFGLTQPMRDSMRRHSLPSSNVCCTCTSI